MRSDIQVTDDLGADMASVTAAPSADYIHAVSKFFDTDPTDMLAELGYYERGPVARAEGPFAELTVPTE